MRTTPLILIAAISLALGACASKTGDADGAAPSSTTPEASAPGADPAPATSPPAQDATTPAMPTDPATPPVANEPGAPAEVADRCNADAARSYVGKTADAAVVEQARTVASAEVARVLKPGQMVTMEFRAGRLNIDVDDGNVITNVRCG